MQQRRYSVKYTNQTCPVCEKAFGADDDIVVCPECATPHHRECWAANGKCANDALHETGYIWGKEETPAPAEEPEPTAVGDIRICHVCGSENPADISNCGNCGAYFGEKKNADNEENKCQFCGSENPDGAKHCNQCGAPLNVATSTAFFGTSPYIAGTNIPAEEKIGENTAATLALYTRTSAKNYLKKFKKFESGKKFSFNFAAFFLSPAWFFYRKLYKFGFVFLLAFTMLTVLTSGLTAPILESLEKYSPEVSAAYDEFYAAYADPDITEEELMAKSDAVSDLALKHFKETWKNYAIFFGANLGGKLVLALIAAFIADKLYYKKAVEDIAEISENPHGEFVGRALISRKGGVSVFAFLACFYGQNYLPSLFSKIADMIKDLI